MREYVKIYCCGDCVYYNWKKHKCNRGATEEGKPTDNFYRDCPIGICIEEEDAERADGREKRTWDGNQRHSRKENRQ